MPLITDIQPQKSKKRVNIYIDGRFSFGIDVENFVRYELKAGKELSQEKIEEIVRKAEFQKVYDKIIAFGTLRPRSEKEFERWLKKHKVHESLHKELFARLQHLELLGDRKFSEWWVTQRSTFKPRSKSALQYELLKKGVDKTIIRDVLRSLVVDEVSLAKELVLKKRRLWENLEKEKAKQKIQMILASKGFGWDVAKKVIGEVLHCQLRE